MKKRQSKKLHKKFIEDVAMDISVTSYWRKAIFEADYGVKLKITKENSYHLPEYIKKPILKFNLRYCVTKIDGEVSDWDFYYDGGVLFKFESIQFKDVYRYSFNNPEVI